MQTISIQVSRPVLKKGEPATDFSAIREVQEHLARFFNTAIPIDNVFSSQLETYVKRYQTQVLVRPDGVVGARTWKALLDPNHLDRPVLRRGDRGDLVAVVQDLLKYDRSLIPANVKSRPDFFLNEISPNGYYFGAIDGEFGLQTEAAIKAFQKDQKVLTVDGVIGAITWNSLGHLAYLMSNLQFPLP